MTQREIAAALGPLDQELSDLSYQYAALGNIGFDEAGRCDWVGTYPSQVTPVVEGMRLTGDFDAVVGTLTAGGYDLLHARHDWVDMGFSYCDALGILIAREEPNREPQKIDAMGVWGRGYWARHRPEVRSVAPTT